MKKYILILLIFNSLISLSQTTDDNCYGLRATHKRTGKIYEFYFYKRVSAKLGDETRNIFITGYEKDSLFLRLRDYKNSEFVYSDIKKIKYIYFDGLYAKRLKPKYFHFEKFILEDKELCNPKTFNSTSTCPYP
jgi:hypothetical protein